MVAVIGCQKMTELTTAEILALMGRVGDVQWESVFGTTFPGYYAMFAQRHMHEFGTTGEQLAAVAVKNHYYGARNDKALFRKEITLEKALASDPVASPLRVYDCCANADGAACLILAAEERAREIVGDRVGLARRHRLRHGQHVGAAPAGPDRPAVGPRRRAPGLRDGRRHAPRDIKVAEVHDCFTIAEIMAYEDLGFCAKGEGGAFIAEKQSYIGGATPVNVDGGLKAKGHPIGATGVSMAYEIVRQLRGECGERQVPDADVGLTHNVGGIGQYCFVHVFRRD